MPVDRERILGNVLSWASWIIKVGGQELHGACKISVGQKRERAKVYGTGRARRPRGRTGGKYSATCKLQVSRGTMNDIIAFLAQFAPDGISYGNVAFDIFATQVEADETPSIYEINGCLIAEEMFDDDGESIDPSKDDLDLDVMDVIKNGKTLYDNTRL